MVASVERPTASENQKRVRALMAHNQVRYTASNLSKVWIADKPLENRSGNLQNGVP